MNKRQPYEEEIAKQLENVPLPDENMAWADMRRRLEEGDDDRVVPFWLNSCLLWTLFGVIILSLGWWVFRPEKWFDRKTAEVNKVTPVSQTQLEQNDSLQEKKTNQDTNIFF